jgi:hypothetical protein
MKLENLGQYHGLLDLTITMKHFLQKSGGALYRDKQNQTNQTTGTTALMGAVVTKYSLCFSSEFFEPGSSVTIASDYRLAN